MWIPFQLGCIIPLYVVFIHTLMNISHLDKYPSWTLVVSDPHPLILGGSVGHQT
jgi:hypothetical protein